MILFVVVHIHANGRFTSPHPLRAEGTLFAREKWFLFLLLPLRGVHVFFFG